MKYEGEIVMCQFLETLHLFWFFDMLINLITIKIEQKKSKKKRKWDMCNWLQNKSYYYILYQKFGVFGKLC